ncbi:hypothetical protein D3C87_2030540 [compost metagenome]
MPDTTSNDSLEVDSTNFEIPIVEPTQPAQNSPVIQKSDEKKTPEQVKQPVTEVPLTKKQERELRRKQRQEEKEKKKNNNE